MYPHYAEEAEAPFGLLIPVLVIGSVVLFTLPSVAAWVTYRYRLRRAGGDPGGPPLIDTALRAFGLVFATQVVVWWIVGRIAGLTTLSFGGMLRLEGTVLVAIGPFVAAGITFVHYRRYRRALTGGDGRYKRRTLSDPPAPSPTGRALFAFALAAVVLTLAGSALRSLF
jgi:hypothetical protein